MSDERDCLRCGKCCHFWVGDKLIRCKYLRDIPNGKTMCRIYPNRLGAKLHRSGVKCHPRKDVPRYIEGCPLNPVTKEEATVK